MDQQIAKAYRELSEKHWWFQSRRAFIMKLVRRIAQDRPLRSILDIGCGDGLLFPELSAFGEVTGIEPDVSLLTDGPHRERIAVTPFDDTFVNDCGQEYDLILMLDVLEHIEDDTGALRRLEKLMANGARAIITVPAHQWLWSQHDVVNQHFRRYTRDTLCGVLSTSKLSIRRVGYYFGWTLLPMAARSVLAPAADTSAVSHYRVSVPFGPLNACLRLISQCDHIIADRVGMPSGTSLFAVLEKAPANANEF